VFKQLARAGQGRRSQGEVRTPETEKQGAPALKLQGKAAGYPQEGTDSANQPLVKPRLSVPSSSPAKGAEAGKNIPVPDLPAASPITTSK
jgi:large repetitive protein